MVVAVVVGTNSFAHKLAQEEYGSLRLQGESLEVSVHLKTHAFQLFGLAEVVQQHSSIPLMVGDEILLEILRTSNLN